MRNPDGRTSNKPLVSVVMPVYNAVPYVAEAVESIISQTYENLEFVIVDDASTDSSYQQLMSYAEKDERIRLFRNETNRGGSWTANRAIALTRGEFIARMDADDVSCVDRLNKQVAHLVEHSNLVAVGGQCYIIDRVGRVIAEKRFPLESSDVHRYIFRFLPVQQGTMMIAKSRLPLDFEYYAGGLDPAEDVELLFKLFQHGEIDNIPHLVLKYRIHGKNASFANIRRIFMLTLISRIRALYRFGYRPSLTGVLITFAQAIAILLLPERMTVTLYKRLRWVRSEHSAGSPQGEPCRRS